MQQKDSPGDIEMMPLNSKELEVEFMEYFSFGKYLELHQRVEYLEDELDRQGVVKKRVPSQFSKRD